MNKNEFIMELAKKLKYLPQEDREDALAYYTEYIDEMELGEDEDVTASIGQPKDVAKSILADVKDKHITQQKEEGSVRGGAMVTWLIILSFFSAPITVPLGIAAVAVVFALMICVFSILLAFGITAFALILAGIIVVALGFSAPGAGATIMVIGAGLFCIGFGLLIGIGVIMAAKAMNQAICSISKR